MNPERWRRIKHVHQSALEVESGRREEYLREACAGDESLLKEVTSLLDQDGNGHGLLDSPALEVVAQALGKEEVHRTHDLAGRTLLHYLIEEKIGQGGMGEVYRARDTRLDRKVALKILPPAFASDQDRMKRFIREAKAASALSHSNVATIFEVGEAEGVNFIAMEYVSGQTLSEYARKHTVEPQQIIDIGIQIADALDEAHGKGIIHRDLKPANAMMTARRQVKVLDFGLAKLAGPACQPGESSPSSLTESGLVIGTVASMSPEQVLGHDLDHRTDIFSLGTILYELATGHSPFAGGTTTEIMDRILHWQPDPIARFNHQAPPELERIVRKCLEKDRDRRYQSARELLIDLENLKRDLASSRQAVQAPRKSLLPAWIPALALAVILAIIAGRYWMNRQPATERETELVPVPLTSYPGYERDPSFSPDGTQVAFQWCKEGDLYTGVQCDIYVKQIGVEPPFRLTSAPADDWSPAWSPDGNFIAFLRAAPGGNMQAMLIPQRGGQERLLGGLDPGAEALPGASVAWTPDSKWLVLPSESKAAPGLVMVSVETLEKKRLTSCSAGFYDSRPAFSPDGRILAFVRGSRAGTAIYILRLGNNGEPQGTPERTLALQVGFHASLAWTPDSEELVFSSLSGLWRMPLSTPGNRRRLSFASEFAFGAPTISWHGNRLAYQKTKWEGHIWELKFGQPGLNPGIPSKLIESTRMEYCAAYSTDGKKIAFCSDRSGSDEIWVCDSDGSNAIQLTSLGGRPTPRGGAQFPVGRPRWSPDGRDIVFGSIVEGEYHVLVVSANGGIPRRLTTDPTGAIPWPCWSRDGNSIYFRSLRGGPSEIWKMPARGGSAVRVTTWGGDLPEESPDGKFLYYTKGYPDACSVWRMPAGGGEETMVVDSTTAETPYAVAKQGIYFFRNTDKKGQVEVCFLPLPTGKTRKMLTIDRASVAEMAASPDGRTILYTQADQTGSDLMLVENFR